MGGLITGILLYKIIIIVNTFFDSVRCFSSFQLSIGVLRELDSYCSRGNSKENLNTQRTV